MSVVPIQAAEIAGTMPAARVGAPVVPQPPVSFAEMLVQGIDATNTKVAQANQLVARAAVDESIPLHQVTFALEEARISLELLVQVRNRLLDASQQLLNMQV